MIEIQSPRSWRAVRKGRAGPPAGGLICVALLALLWGGTACSGTDPLVRPPTAADLRDLERALATPPEMLGVTAPRPIEGACPAPAYDPPAGFDGELVAVAVLDIDASGRVRTVEIVEPSALPAFDEAVLRTLATWRFEPARRHEKAVPCRQRIRVRHGEVGDGGGGESASSANH